VNQTRSATARMMRPSLPISVFGRPRMLGRLVILSILAVPLSACDTMIADRLVIRAPATQPSPAASTGDVLATTRIAFGDCGLAQADITNFGDELHWRNPKRPPGLHVMVHAAGEDLLVTLAQDLFGPIGRTGPYRCVKKSLRLRLQERYGNEGVRVKS